MNIFVGNLPYQTSSDDLEQLFGQQGNVASAQVIIDRTTGQSRGFGFVEMSDDEEGRKAVAELNGADVNGRRLTVNEARPRENRSHQPR